MENGRILHVITEEQQTIIKRLKKLPVDAAADDICMALDEILYELSAGQSE